MRALRILAIGLSFAGCSCSPSSPSPSRPSPGAALAVTGPSSLSVGHTAQLTAIFTSTSGARQDVTAQAIWQSSNIVAATVSSMGLVTARGFGAANITATYQGLTSAVSLSVGQASVAACGRITQPGSYVLTTDLAQQGGTSYCLSIVQSDVQLDCQNHKVPGISIIGVNRITITNCSISNDAASALDLHSAQHVTVSNSTLSSGVSSAGAFGVVSGYKA